MEAGPGGIPEDEVCVIHVELRLDGPMPAGIATRPGGTAREFTGWVGLMSAVDTLAGRGEVGRAGDGVPRRP
jgi:hypothetical protein